MSMHVDKRFLLFNLALLFGIGLFAQIPEGYYKRAEGKNGESLKTALYSIIKGHEQFNYDEVYDALIILDKDTNNSRNVIGIYSGFSMDGKKKYNQGKGWNREHVWAKSKGDFGTKKGAGTDLHHIVAADVSTNSARNNRNFDLCPEPYTDQSGIYKGLTKSGKCVDKWCWEPRDKVKGDIARMIFYMATRYEGENGEPDLELIDHLTDKKNKTPFHARLSVLLEWHEQDPVDAKEKRRNDLIFEKYQRNRNPYIDHPEFVTKIWTK